MTGAELKQWRARLGWTQDQAAKALGIQPPYYRELESGRQPIRQVYALAIETLEHNQRAQQHLVASIGSVAAGLQ